jgi:biopolymer transport protein ExbD
MKVRRGNIHPHNEPPAVLLVDIAFNLLIFFVVCASTQPTSGRRQDIPGSEAKASATPQKNETIDVALTRTTATINGDRVRPPEFVPRLRELLKGRTRPEDRIVVVKSSADTPYAHWIDVTGWIEEAGGVITLQIEESHEVTVQ